MRITAMLAAMILLVTAIPAARAQQDPADLPSDSGGQSSSAQTQTPDVVVIAATPPTQIEAFEQTPGALIVKRFTKIATVASDDGGTMNIYAVALQNTANNSRLNGVALEIVQRGGRVARAYIDANEIDPLLNSLDDLDKLARSDSPLDEVEGRYQTRGHLQFLNVDNGGGRSVVIHALQVAPVTGVVSSAAVRVRPGRLAEVRQQISLAKDTLAKADTSK